MGYAKIVLGGEVKLDLTEDSVSETSMLQGVTAHDRAGDPIRGTIPTRSERSITISEDRKRVILPAGYYPKGMVIVQNEKGEWEWNPFDFAKGVLL